MNRDIRLLAVRIFSNLMTMFIVFVVPVILGFLLTSSLEARLAFINTGLILFLISLVFYIHFTPEQPKLLQPLGQPYVYLIEKNTSRYIPDGETLEYLEQLNGINRHDIEQITPEEFNNKFTAGSALPSIIPHCETYHKKLCAADLQEKQ